MKRFFLSLAAVVAASFVLVSTSNAQNAQNTQDADGFEKIFNGVDLTGWSGDPRLWSVEDGCIVGTTNDSDKKITANQSLFFEKDQNIGDFIAKFDFKISKGGNSGLYYRGWFLDGPEKWRLGGYQADFDGDVNYSGIMYGEALRGILANLGTVSKVDKDGKIQELARFKTADDVRKTVAVEGWNHYEVFAQGYLFIHKINGEVTSIFVDEDSDAVRRPSGVFGWQLHVGPAMRVEIKNLYLKKL